MCIRDRYCRGDGAGDARYYAACRNAGSVFYDQFLCYPAETGSWYSKSNWVYDLSVDEPAFSDIYRSGCAGGCFGTVSYTHLDVYKRQVQMLSYVQLITPSDLIGKIMALATCLCMCAAPLGQALYGWLFEAASAHLYVIFFCAAAASCLVALFSRKSFKRLADLPVINEKTDNGDEV